MQYKEPVKSMDPQTALPGGKFDTQYRWETLRRLTNCYITAFQKCMTNTADMMEISHIMHPCLIINSLTNQGRFVSRLS